MKENMIQKSCRFTAKSAHVLTFCYLYCDYIIMQMNSSHYYSKKKEHFYKENGIMLQFNINNDNIL